MFWLALLLFIGLFLLFSGKKPHEQLLTSKLHNSKGPSLSVGKEAGKIISKKSVVDRLTAQQGKDQPKIEQKDLVKRNMVKRNYESLRERVPQAAAGYCIDLWKDHNFPLRIKGDRKTKLGDFRVARGEKVSISVNGTLNPYAFLITYLHELAHLLNWQQHRLTVKPHGPEWQEHFRQLMLPMLSVEVFPADILLPLKKYMQAPAASTSASQPLWMALRRYDENSDENKLFLAQIPDGNKFRFSDNVYLKVEMRRTRALCQNMSNGRRYLISTAAQVELVA